MIRVGYHTIWDFTFSRVWYQPILTWDVQRYEVSDQLIPTQITIDTRRYYFRKQLKVTLWVMINTMASITWYRHRYPLIADTIITFNVTLRSNVNTTAIINWYWLEMYVPILDKLRNKVSDQLILIQVTMDTDVIIIEINQMLLRLVMINTRASIKWYWLT